MKKTLICTIALIAAIFPVVATAQLSSKVTYVTRDKDTIPKAKGEPILEKMKRNGVFNQLEIAANIGTTGLGLELASPITKWTKLRVGFDVMPRFTIPMTFGMESYVDGKMNDKFDRIQEMMYGLSGMRIDDEIKMESTATMANFRLLVDVYPFKNNRHWHITAGFFVGGKSVGKTINTMTEMPSLLALNMYDRLYRGVTDPDFLFDVMEPDYLYNITGIEALKGEFLSVTVAEELQNKFKSFGELGVHVGDFGYDEKGNPIPYLMLPDEDGTVSAKAKVNSFRPYLGFGYGGALSSDGKWQVGVDAGVQFWGGAPKVTTHDGTVLNDLINVRGKVGTYMDLMKALPVYPTIDFRISYTF